MSAYQQEPNQGHPLDYTYTRPRRAIAAMYSGPGPCYGLPGLVGQPKHDPRSVHYRGPSYAFGIRHGKLKDDCSPGPCYLPESKIYKEGKDGTPHYSLYAKRRPLSMFATPGPGAYSPEHVGEQAKFHAPVYSFGSRHRHRGQDKVPAPNAYTLDTMTGPTVRSGKRQAPNFTMRAKYTNGAFYEDLCKTPGPAAHQQVIPDKYNNRNTAPSYSMTSRNHMPGDGSQKPGPGAHSPEKVYKTKRQAPQFSFGIRHSQYECPLIIDPVS